MQTLFVFLLLTIITINGQDSLFDVSDLDWSIRPSDNFFMFVNGRWINRTVIPLSETEYGGIYTMKYENKYKLKQILDDLLRNEKSDTFYASPSVKQKLTDFYLAGLDQTAIERAGIEPLKDTLINLQNTQTYQELIMFVLNWYKKMNTGLIFEFDVFADERDTSTYMANWRVKTDFRRIKIESF
jgi:putative endopeptidase